MALHRIVLKINCHTWQHPLSNRKEGQIHSLYPQIYHTLKFGEDRSGRSCRDYWS